MANMEEIVLKILMDVFELDTLDKSCSQSTCEKWDSMGVLNLVVELESEFGVSLEPEEIAQLVSYKDVISVLKKKL